MKNFSDSDSLHLMSEAHTSPHPLIPIGSLAFGVSLLLAGCSGPDPVDGKATSGLEQTILTFNGQSWNGQSWNGQSWNGQSWNGQSWNGLGWNGQSWNGIGWNGQSWNGQSWNGQSWNGQSWNGQSWNGVSGQDAPIFTALHNWVNHSDTNGNGIPNSAYINQCGPNSTYSPSYLNDSDDLNARLSALAAWVSCACAAGTSIPFSDTHGRTQTIYFNGGLGLAPDWCGDKPGSLGNTGPVPQDQVQIVSACLMARINMKGKHYPLSLRSLEAGTAVSTNEGLLLSRPLARYWGNLWSTPYLDNDTTTPVSGDPNTSGGPWWNLNRFSCALGFSGPPLASDQYAFGRDCELGTCGNHLEYLGTCWNVWGSLSYKVLGNYGQWDPNSSSSYYQGADATYATTLVAGGLGFTAGIGTGGTNIATAYYRNHNPNNAPNPNNPDNLGWRAIETFGAYTITVEDPATTPPARGTTGQTSPPYAWTQVEAGSTVPPTLSIYCSTFTDAECQKKSSGDNGRKLAGLADSQAVSINFSGNYAAPPNNMKGNPLEPVSLAIRYSRPKQLGAGQCDVDLGCNGTPWWECASGSISSLGCVGGSASTGALNIWVGNNKPNSNFWHLVHGLGTPYGKEIFLPTYADTQYSTAYIYPIYLQNSSSSVSGWSDQAASDMAKVDTVRAWLNGTTHDTGAAPNIDSAYYFPGPPPSDANCQAGNSCWVFAGPSYGISTPIPVTLGYNQQWSYVIPTLPGGTYTFTMSPTSSTSDQDLYVRLNGVATPSSWTCRPYLGAGAAETCTVVVPSSGGSIGVMINGFTNGTTTSNLTHSLGDPALQISQGQPFSYTTPQLPPGTYTFSISPSAGTDVDLYVKVNGTPTLSSYDCRPYYGAGAAETCIVSLTGNGGTVGVMLNGYSSGVSTTSFIAHN